MVRHDQADDRGDRQQLASVAVGDDLVDAMEARVGRALHALDALEFAPTCVHV
jgi:hypothetical protein